MVLRLMNIFLKVFDVGANNSGLISPRRSLDPPHYDGIQSLALYGDILFSGSRDTCIKKWDLNKGEHIQSLNNAHKDWVCALCFLPGGQIVLSGKRHEDFLFSNIEEEDRFVYTHTYIHKVGIESLLKKGCNYLFK